MKEFVFWIMIFIMVNLAIHFLLYPETVTQLTENVKNTFQKLEPVKTETVRIVPSRMEEYYPIGILYQSCVSLEAMGEMEGVINIKKKACIEACAKRDMNYYSTDCEKDLLVCYCEK